MRELLFGALGGGGVGLVAGFVVAVIVLQLRHLRNARLMRRGQSPIRDCVLPPFYLPGAIFGVVGGGSLSLALPLWTAIVIGGSVVPALLLLLSGGFAIASVFGRGSPYSPS